MSPNQQVKKDIFVPLTSEQFVTNYSDKRSRRKKLFQKLALAQSDIHSAYKACELFRERVVTNTNMRPEDTVKVGLNNPLYLPLLEAIIISYSRPFIDNDGLGVLPKKWSTFENKQFGEVHKFVLRYRNELVAHSDQTRRKIQIFGPNAHFGPVADRRKMEGAGFAISNFWISLRQIETIYRLSSFQSKRLMDETMLMLDELYGGMELPNKSFDLRIDEGL